MGAKFDVTPEKQASVPRFFYNQITVKAAPVKGVSLAGKTALVTGSNTGVGLETSRQLLDLGLSKLILAVRSEEKGQTAKKNLSAGRDLSDDSIEVWNLDQSDYDSVVTFAERTKSLPRLDIAVLNIGIANATRVFNAKTGHDEMIQVNYLSTALLAILLLPVVKEKSAAQGGPSRITIVSSEVAAWTAFKEKQSFPLLASLDKKNTKVDPLDRMMVSKLLGQFFLSRLASIVPPSVAVINAVSPGSVHDSDFNREHDKTFSGAIAKVAMRRMANTAAVGARMVTDAAVNHGQETHGEFLSFQKLVPLAPIIYSAEGKKISEQLWKETSEELAFAKVEEILKGVSE
ncbi:NAD(P)-binding protein [Aspergillus homomorphus CBS 101889]|uniref:NAD(P)-binding protein n=1 Tax=Aspergillus homomorphus (strain CBS 101889) TaxID=1450537 RepID=A0A395I1A1_ASPHC|nr:NAD(P)-binding protein [Aspergillus homomorphus CBS 101889]RAL12938.1 NAD(P)-binding protein [Aspergillus homomorphus CBS 101889]